MDDLDGARVLVLGGSGVLGSRLARRLKDEGSRIVLAGRDHGRLAALGEELGAQTVPADLRDPVAAASTVATTVRILGGIDGLINAAGVVAFGSLEETDDATLDEVITTDLIAPLRVMREAIRSMNGGFVVNITGVVAEQPPAGMTAYSAAKAGLSAASRALSRELRRRRIRVLDVRPPHTETGLAGRPIAGTAPALPAGLDPDDVAERIVEAVKEGKRELAASDFE